MAWRAGVGCRALIVMGMVLAARRHSSRRRWSNPSPSPLRSPLTNQPLRSPRLKSRSPKAGGIPAAAELEDRDAFGRGDPGSSRRGHGAQAGLRRSDIRIEKNDEDTYQMQISNGN